MSDHTLQELEQALFNAAMIVQKHGEKFAPTMDRLVREVEAAREKFSSRDRASQILSSLSVSLPSNSLAGLR